MLESLTYNIHADAERGSEQPWPIEPEERGPANGPERWNSPARSATVARDAPALRRRPGPRRP